MEEKYERIFLVGTDGLISLFMFGGFFALGLLSFIGWNLLLVLIAILFMAISCIAFGITTKEVYIKREPKIIIELKGENKK